jgi:hypothetical protein
MKGQAKAVPVLKQLNISPRSCMGKLRYIYIILNFGTRLRRTVSFTPWPLYLGEQALNMNRIVGRVKPSARMDVVDTSCPIYS